MPAAPLAIPPGRQLTTTGIRQLTGWSAHRVNRLLSTGALPSVPGIGKPPQRLVESDDLAVLVNANTNGRN